MWETFDADKLALFDGMIVLPNMYRVVDEMWSSAQSSEYRRALALMESFPLQSYVESMCSSSVTDTFIELDTPIRHKHLLLRPFANDTVVWLKYPRKMNESDKCLCKVP